MNSTWDSLKKHKSHRNTLLKKKKKKKKKKNENANTDTVSTLSKWVLNMAFTSIVAATFLYEVFWLFLLPSAEFYNLATATNTHLEIIKEKICSTLKVLSFKHAQTQMSGIEREN